MKKKCIILNLIIILSILSLILVACSKKNNTKDNLNNNAPVVEDTNNDIDEKNNKNDKLEENDNDTKAEVQEDVYDMNSNLEQENDVDIKPIETVVTDSDILNSLEEFLNIFYYNYGFADIHEDGIITEDDMQLFAIFQIYQHEYSELKYDEAKNQLYIPEEHVTSVVKKFFGINFNNHKQPKVEYIQYKDGNYILSEVDGGDLSEPRIIKVVKINDFSFEIEFESINSNGENIEILDKFNAIVEEREGRYILLKYGKVSK